MKLAQNRVQRRALLLPALNPEVLLQQHILIGNFTLLRHKSRNKLNSFKL